MLRNRLSLGFKAQKPVEYSATLPQMSLRQNLSGPLVSEGMIFGPTGRVVSRFTADMHGAWDGPKGLLKEHFTFASGDTQDRVWDLTTHPDGSFSGTAHDIVGRMRGETIGATTRMSYRLRLAPDAGGHVLNVVDWMYLSENGTILNRAQMRKFGIKVAELFATIRPKSP